MKNLKVRLTFQEGVLGTSPSSEEVYRDYIGSKAPDASTVDDEVAALGVDAVVEKGTTVFGRTPNGEPFLYDYQIKGFFKGACGMLRKMTGSESSKIKAYKKEIDGLIFPEPRKIVFHGFDKIGSCERPLRAQTMQGERISLAKSEEIPAGSWIDFNIVLLDDGHEKVVREWLDYGVLSGIGQWRNSGKGRVKWEELDSNGEPLKKTKHSDLYKDLQKLYELKSGK